MNITFIAINPLNSSMRLEIVLTYLFIHIIGLNSKINVNIIKLYVNYNFWNLIIEDIIANYIKDPACYNLINCINKFGFKAIFLYRLASIVDSQSLKNSLLAMIVEYYGTEICNGAKIGRYFVLDHTVGITIGQQAILGDNVVLMHNITLGALGNRLGTEIRHPIISSGVVMGAGATALGCIEIGHCCIIAASAVVTKRILPYNIVAGVPALILI